MQARTLGVLRSIAAAAAGGALMIHVLNLGFTAWVSRTGSAELLGIDMGIMVVDAFVTVAWGIGFPVLALVMIWRIGDQPEVVMAALFLGVYALWGAVLDTVPFEGAPWRRQALMTGDALAHSIGIRFTQLFPRPLSPSDVRNVGPAWFRASGGRMLAALVDPRIFWGFAVLLEGTFWLTPIPAPWHSLHLVVWLALGTFFLYRAYASGTSEDQRRIFWILEGVVVFLVERVLYLGLRAVGGSGLLELDVPFWSNVLRAVAAWLTLGCFVMAVFYAGAFDSGMVLKRTTVLGLTAGITIVIFVTLETLLEELLASSLGLESRMGGIVGGVGAAIAFRPISQRIEKMMSRVSSEELAPPVERASSENPQGGVS